MYKFFSSNSKTGLSYDFGICPLMTERDGKFKAVCGVQRCYSAYRLNSHQGTGLLKKLKGMPSRLPLIKSEVAMVNGLHTVNPQLVRGFSFADYMPEYKEEFLYLVRNLATRHIIISKTLWLLAPELIEETGNKVELSLGFTRQLYPKFKKFFTQHESLKFSVAYTYTTLEDVEWLKSKDHELFLKVDVFHDESIHMRKGRQFSKLKGTNVFTATALGMQRKFQEHLVELKNIHTNTAHRQCNIYGPDQQIKDCKSCNGCASISRRGPG